MKTHLTTMKYAEIKSSFPSILITILIVFIVGIAVSYIPQIPYNIREIFDGTNLFYNTLLISACLYTGFGLPTLLTMTLARNIKAMAIQLPFATLIQTTLTWFLVRLTVPLESIHDILGTPVLGWPWEWELIMRFIALFSVPSLLITLSTLIALSLPLRANAIHSYYKIIFWLPAALPVLALSHVILVKYAATDNLTELMASGGNLISSVMLTLWCLCLIYTATLLAYRWASKEGINLNLTILVTVVASAPLAYLFLVLGTESHVNKYNQTFSALQFLLSQDREHLISGIELYIRFAIAHYGGITFLFLAQFPFWQTYMQKRAQTQKTTATRPVA